MARVLDSRKRDQVSQLDQARVLVVEGEKALRGSFVRSLGRRGLHVDMAASRDEAMELIERYPYPVIVADTALSEREGIDLVRELRNVRPEASFIITTAEDTPEPDEAPDGVTRVLRKPWSERQLRTALENARESYNTRQLSQAPADPAPLPAHAVLLIDDKVDSTQHLLALLQRSAVASEIQHCANATDALKLVPNRTFEVILLNDRGLGAARRRTLEQLRRAAPNTAVIALSERMHDGQQRLRARKNAKTSERSLPDTADTLRQIILSAIERNQKDATTTFLTQVDPLTQLASQAAFGEQLEACVAKARRAQTRCAVMLINLAEFSTLNAEHGHEAGDTVLCEIGRRIQASVREDDTVARLSADEYAVLLTQVEDPAICPRIANRILGITGLPVLIRDDLVVQLRAHVGIALYPDSCQGSDTLLRHAHDALCTARSEKLDFAVHTATAAANHAEESDESEGADERLH